MTHDQVASTDNASRGSLIVSRRRTLVGAAWVAPTIVVASAVPAHAHSGSHTWSIQSLSYEGDGTSGRPDNDIRANSGDYRMKFNITVPAGSIVHAPQMVLQGLASGGNGIGPVCALGSSTAAVTTASPSGSVGGWSVTGSGALGGDSANAFRTFTFTRTTIDATAGAQLVTLNFNLLGVSTTDAGSGLAITFSSSQSSNIGFTLLAANTGTPGYATNPAG